MTSHAAGLKIGFWAAASGLGTTETILRALSNLPMRLCLAFVPHVGAAFGNQF